MPSKRKSRGPVHPSEPSALPPTLFARLYARVALEAHPSGHLVACFDGHRAGLGKWSAGAVARAQALRTGLPLGACDEGLGSIEGEVRLLLHKLARQGLLEYRLARSQDAEDQVVIEPQVAGYWPRTRQLSAADVVVLSRFAYMRRRGNEMVLESPRAGALFRICNPSIASTLAMMSQPRPVGLLCRDRDFPGEDLLGLLLDCDIVFKPDPARGTATRSDEGDDKLVLWDFHDLLFHARSTQGRHANPVGGTYAYAGVLAPLPAVRPRWSGKKIVLSESSGTRSAPGTRAARLLAGRHSVRIFDDAHPITLRELAGFLGSTARVQSRFRRRELGRRGAMVGYAVRPYPSGGASYALELYLAVRHCRGLAPGFYHYDAGGHALRRMEVPASRLEALMRGAEFAMGAPAPPQILVTIAARFGRVAWKYSSIAYSLILKDTGVLMQTFYLMATDMRLGGCAIGTTHIDLFASMTGLEFHVEGPVGQFAFGRPAAAKA